MDSESVKSGHKKVLKSLPKRLKEIGFNKYSNTFFFRPKDKFAQFIHLHKFTGNAHYRVHLGIRVLNDTREFFHLNGICSDSYLGKQYISGKEHNFSYRNGKKYNFRYHKADETIERCVENIFQFCAEVGEKWFDEWNDCEKLITSPYSPLNLEEKNFLRKLL